MLGYNWILKGALAPLLGGLLCLSNPLDSAPLNAPPLTQQTPAWKEFHSTAGKCSLIFPQSPEHVSEKMVMPDEGYELKYDAYISALNQQAVFMLLVAQYPESVDQAYAQMNLEAFLNGILTHNPDNQLIYADLLLVGAHEALDFFIRTGGLYFKGRALMIGNSLYLMAMECEIQHYDESHFNNFVGSFKLIEDAKK